jgi:hypothetical protein
MACGIANCVVCSVEHFDTSELPRISRARLGPAGSAWEPALMLSFLEKLLEWTLLHAAADGLYTLEYVPSLRAVTLTSAQGREEHDVRALNGAVGEANCQAPVSCI